jgi:nitrilase
MKSCIAAVIQSASELFDTPRTLEKMRDLLASAKAEKAELAVLPEAFIGGYPKGVQFGAHIGSRSPQGREEFRRYFESAICVPGPECELISEMAREFEIQVVVGVVERDGGTLYCSVLFFDADGRLTGKHSKVMPTAMERIIWGFGDGSTLEVQDTALGRIGAVICWENYMPQLRLSQYAQGIEIYCAPTVDERETWLPTMQTIALEGRCFVLSACQFMQRRHAPENYSPVQGNDPETTLIRGGSCIVSPLGEVLAGPVFDQEAILTARLDSHLIAQGKFDFDVTGHYARPDIFELRVNTRKQSPSYFASGG